MKKILVTGASGVIGRHCLLPLLNKGYEVHAVSYRKIYENTPHISWHQVNLLDSEAVSKMVSQLKPTHLLHLAWYTTPGKYWTSLENIEWVKASLTLLKEFAKFGGQRVVMAGTCAEYDWKDGYCSERSTPLLPVTLYGACKHSLHVISDAFAREVGLSSAWGRIFFLYGPGENSERLVSSVIQSLLRGEPARCSHGNQIRDFLYCEDIANAFVALLDSQVIGPVNIASGIPIAIKDIISKIAEKLGRQDLIQFGALPVSTNEPRLVVADISRLKNEIGWQPKYDLDTGLRQTIDWWKSSLHEKQYESTK